MYYDRGHNVVITDVDGSWAKTVDNGWVSTKYIEYIGTAQEASESNESVVKSEEKKEGGFGIEIKSLRKQKYENLFMVLLVLFTIGTIVLVVSDDSRRFLWLSALLYFCAVVSTILYVCSVEKKDLTGFIDLVVACVCSLVVLSCQVGCFNEITNRLLRRSTIGEASRHNITYVTLIVCLGGALISALCLWLDWDITAIAMICGVFVLCGAVYIATNGFEFSHMGYAIPNALFYIVGCGASYAVGTLVCTITLPLAAILFVVGVLGMRSDGGSERISADSAGRADTDDFSWTGYIPNFHKGPTGMEGWDDNGNRY